MDRERKFYGKFHLTAVTDYTLSERKFGSDFSGHIGGDQFDFWIDWNDLREGDFEGESVTEVKFIGHFKIPPDWSDDEALSTLENYIGQPIQSWTSKWPQMFEIHYGEPPQNNPGGGQVIKGIKLSGKEYGAFTQYLNEHRVQNFTGGDVSNWLKHYHSNPGNPDVKRLGWGKQAFAEKPWGKGIVSLVKLINPEGGEDVWIVDYNDESVGKSLMSTSDFNKARNYFDSLDPSQAEHGNPNGLQEVLKREGDYIRQHGELTEADFSINDIQRDKVQAYWKLHPDTHVGLVNRYDRKRNFLQKYNGEKVLNFEWEFIIPQHDAELLRLLQVREQATYTGTKADVERLTPIWARIEQLGGLYLIWV